MADFETFGRYQLVKVVGTGGMAQVHLARQVGPGRFVKPCVLKRIAPEHLGNEVIRGLFLEEARISALLNHPNVVSTFDFGEVNRVPYMAMEWVDGVNLAQLCKTLAKEGRWLGLGPAVEILLAVLEALEYAHKLTDLDGRPLHLVHRDVSPQNVLLSGQGVVKLADFGIARHEQREIKTVGPTTKGKPGYMAPEQAMGSEVDARADLFAVGIMLAELISARRVLAKKEIVGILQIEARVKALCALRPDAPKALVDAALALTALEPDQRPSSAQAAGALLRRASASLPQNTLHECLAGIFTNYLIGPDADGSDPSASAAPVAFTNDPTEVMPGPPPGVTGDLVLSFDERPWAEQEKASGTAAAYEGWPANVTADLGLKHDADPIQRPPPASRPEPAPAAPSGPDKAVQIENELVQRSSSMDAMQFFGAVHSEEAAQRGKLQLPLPPGVTASSSRTQGGTGKPTIPLRSAAIDQAVASAQDAVEIVVPGVPVKTRLLPLLPLIGAALAVLLIGLGVMAAFTLRGPEKVVHASGTISVRSTPAGAPVFLDGKPTDRRTPTELAGLPVDSVHRVAVVLPGHRTLPREAQIQIPPSGQTLATFILKRGRSYQITSAPSDALVTVDGKKLATPTPVDLEILPFGETATITVNLDSHLPAMLLLKSEIGTATVVTVTLKKGRQLEIASEPEGAEITVDGIDRGKAPVYDLMVPAVGSFTVVGKKKGFKTWKQRIEARKLKEGPLVIELQPLPFLAMPMTPEERKEAKALDLRGTKLAADRRRTKERLKVAEEKLENVESDRRMFVGDTSNIQRQVDELRQHLDAVETELSEVQANIEGMRDTLQNRMESD